MISASASLITSIPSVGVCGLGWCLWLADKGVFISQTKKDDYLTAPRCRHAIFDRIAHRFLYLVEFQIFDCGVDARFDCFPQGFSLHNKFSFVPLSLCVLFFAFPYCQMKTDLGRGERGVRFALAKRCLR
jgi:hypothetical protein